jgi:hypothetical protein
MLTCKSPRKVMRVAYLLARQCLPDYSCKFSRHDFTLPQLFACLVVKEQLKRSYRGAEALLRDCDQWCKDLGMGRVPDHNTLCRAAAFLLGACRVGKLLDAVARWAALARVLGLSLKPLALDSTHYESHHVSRHYQRRCHKTRLRMRRAAGKNRRETVRRLPKLSMAVSAHSHLVLAIRPTTGAGSDSPHFKPLLRAARRRLPHKHLRSVQDAGYDGEENHRWAREEMGIRSITPPAIGRPARGGRPPEGRWRRHMARLLKSKASRRSCKYTQRAQAETVNSMMKRNLGSALRGKTAWSRRRDMALKALTHDLMVL